MRNKYFYPIFKLKTKSWIRYWLLKKTEFKGKLSEILTGFSFNLENTLNRKFKIFEIQGHSIQDGEPSPENEVPILSSGDNGSITEKIVNVNLFDKDTVLRDKTFTSQDVVSTSTGLYVSDYIKVTPNTSYYVNENCSVVIGLDKNKVSLGYLRNSSQAGTITTPNNCEWIRVRLHSTSIAMETAISNAMVNLGSTAIPYIAHEEQTYSVYTQQPFRSIGDVRDVFFKNTVDSPYYDENLVENGWYERHIIKEQKMDLLNWSKIDNSRYSDSIIRFSSNVRNSNTIMSSSLSSKTLLSNRFICKYLGVAYTSECIAPHLAEKNQINVFIGKSRLTEETVQALNNYLDSIGAKVNYILENPTNIPCTTEQTNILENIPITYEGQTNVYSTDEVEPYLKIQYWESDTNG